HLVGDIHAPLHVTDMHNQFGQVIQVAAQDNSITPGTLFGYWEQALVRRLGLHEQAVAQELIAGISPNEQDLWAGQVTHIWALESHQHGIEHAYGTMLSKFEDGRFVISPAELDRGRAIVTEQMSKAGVRLAGLLNAALAAQPASRVTSPVAGNVARGRAIAEAKCVVCHIIGGGVGEGPAYTTAPDFATVANTRNMSPIVLRSFLTGPHPTMPRLSLNEEQVRDIIAYIMSQHLAP
ncbi:MAG: c-type cytochrome, partial [Rhodospirillaceae bacterium]|nr:c-type cytochrome [Rhodospirillaceae bacterium]